MIAVLKQGTTEEQITNLTHWFEEQGVSVHKTVGVYQTILGLVGDTSRIDTELLEGLDIVCQVTRVTEPFKNANRKFHPDDTVIDINGNDHQQLKSAFSQPSEACR